jgi:peroxiredoxin
MIARPRNPAPPLEVDIVGGGHFSIHAAKPRHFTMIVVYRSLHCPLCKRYLGEIESRLAKFESRGVEVIAVSVDGPERASRAKEEWGLANLRVGHGLSIPAARAWNLYISSAQKDTEPAEFAEPGLFLVLSDGNLYSAHISSVPWARPPLDDVLAAIDSFIANPRPARGEA